MKQQKTDIQIEVYKKMVDESNEFQTKSNDLENLNQKLILQIKGLEHDLKEVE